MNIDEDKKVIKKILKHIEERKQVNKNTKVDK